MIPVGIDLGTTNSVAARAGEVLPISDEGQTTLPSVVAFLPNGHAQVGEAARRRRAIDSENTIFSSKRLMGRRFDTTETANFQARYPVEMVELEDGMPAFRTRAGLVTPVQVATIVLGSLVKRAGLQTSDSEAIVTVPSAFSEGQRTSTLHAASSAGLRAILLDEPSATAYAYLSGGFSSRYAVVYDLGGGTFDCAVVDCQSDQPRVLGHAGDLLLGGDDIDQRLAEWVSQYVLEKHNWDLSNYSEIKDRLLARCEEAKIRLSSEPEAEIYLSQIDPDCPAADDAVVLSRSLLDELCQDLVRRSFVVCDDVLRAADLRPSDVDAVLLAGGTTLLPMIQQNVEAYFGRPGMMEFDPTEVVALGASFAGVSGLDEA
jgi:molecular chaperone DnaK